MFLVGLLLIVFFAVVGKVVRSTGRPTIPDEEAIRSKQRMEILHKVHAETTAQTTTYAWVDRAKGVVRVPMDRAMELTVAKLSAQGAPHPAYPVPAGMALESTVKPGGLAVTPAAPPPFPTSAPPAAEPVSSAPAQEPSASETSPTPEAAPAQ